MKKKIDSSSRKLSLSTETVRALHDAQIAGVNGGAKMTELSCMTMGTACRTTYSALCTLFPACGY